MERVSLNAHSHRATVRDLVVSESISLVCLQETNLNVILDLDVMELLGRGFGFVYLPADHYREGILVA
jgi:hypothetical protein